METRNKSKNPTPTEGADSHESLSQELATRQYELSIIERAISDKEKRVTAQESSLRQELDRIEAEHARLERDREQFNRIMVNRESEIAERERELERKLSDYRSARVNTPIHAPIIETPSGSRREPNCDYSLNRSPPSGGGGSSGGSSEPSTPKVSFREATETVPYFDGYNIPLAQFTRACRRACEIIPPTAERNLTKLLINKLGQRAYYAVEDEPCDTVTELIDLLTGAFGSPKTLDQYRGELSTIFLRPNEHVLDYISRVKDIRTAILDAERRDKRKLDPHFIAEINNLTARSFYEGLPLEYRLQISPEVRCKHTDAFAAAKTIAKRQELDRQRYRSDREQNARPSTYSTPTRSDYTAYRQPDHSRSNPRKEPPLQTYDPRSRDSFENPNTRYQRSNSQNDLRGRDSSENPNTRYQRSNSQSDLRGRDSSENPNTRYQRSNSQNDLRGRDNFESPNTRYQHSNSQKEPSNQTYDPRNGNKYTEPYDARQGDKFCRYCKSIGHEIHECRKRQYNNARREESGNMPGPSGRRDMPPADEQRQTRPMNPIMAEEERCENDPELQS